LADFLAAFLVVAASDFAASLVVGVLGSSARAPKATKTVAARAAAIVRIIVNSCDGMRREDPGRRFGNAKSKPHA